MKEELIRLGFDYADIEDFYFLYIEGIEYIEVFKGIVQLTDESNTIKLFPYNYDKVKQLIELLS